jgi:site-specific recombinase
MVWAKLRQKIALEEKNEKSLCKKFGNCICSYVIKIQMYPLSIFLQLSKGILRIIYHHLLPKMFATLHKCLVNGVMLIHFFVF